MIVSVPHIKSDFSKETASLFKEKLKVVCRLDNVDHLGPPSIDLTNLKVRDYSNFGVTHGPEIQCNVELQCFDYWQPKSNFNFKKYPAYGGYLLPRIEELNSLDHFEIYGKPFSVVKDKERFFNCGYKWISIYSLFFLTLEEIKKLLSKGYTKIFFSEESYDRCFLSFIKVFNSLGIEEDQIKERIGFVGGTMNQNNRRIHSKYNSCPITMMHPTYFNGCEDNFNKITQTDEKEKDILYLVRKPRNHRIIPLILLNNKSNISDHVITYPSLTKRDDVSYKNLHDGKKIKHKQNLIDHLENSLSPDMVERYRWMSNVELDFPLTAEYSEEDEINTISWTTMIEPDVKNFMYTKLSVVSETYAFNSELNNENPSRGEVFLTEKTGRCLYYGHPFVLISTMDSLKILKQYGFNTYDDFFDTFYDEIKNDYDRFESAVESSLTFIKNWDFIDKTKLKEVIRYNHTHFTHKFIPNIFKIIYEK
jgi:hypothetical protein